MNNDTRPIEHSEDSPLDHPRVEAIPERDWRLGTDYLTEYDIEREERAGVCALTILACVLIGAGVVCWAIIKQAWGG